MKAEFETGAGIDFDKALKRGNFWLDTYWYVGAINAVGPVVDGKARQRVINSGNSLDFVKASEGLRIGMVAANFIGAFLPERERDWIVENVELPYDGWFNRPITAGNLIGSGNGYLLDERVQDKVDSVVLHERSRELYLGRVMNQLDSRYSKVTPVTIENALSASAIGVGLAKMGRQTEARDVFDKGLELVQRAHSVVPNLPRVSIVEGWQNEWDSGMYGQTGFKPYVRNLIGEMNASWVHFRGIEKAVPSLK